MEDHKIKIQGYMMRFDPEHGSFHSDCDTAIKVTVIAKMNEAFEDGGKPNVHLLQELAAQKLGCNAFRMTNEIEID